MKYKVIKAVESKQWYVDDIVEVVGKLPERFNGILRPYIGSNQHKHVLMIANPVPLKSKINVK